MAQQKQVFVVPMEHVGIARRLVAEITEGSLPPVTADPDEVVVALNDNLVVLYYGNVDDDFITRLHSMEVVVWTGTSISGEDGQPTVHFEEKKPTICDDGKRALARTLAQRLDLSDGPWSSHVNECWGCGRADLARVSRICSMVDAAFAQNLARLA